MQFKIVVNNLAIKYASNPYYEKAYFAFLCGGEMLGTDYIPLKYFVESSDLASIFPFLFNLILGIALIVFGLKSSQKISKTPPSPENLAPPTDTVDLKTKSMQQIAPILFFWSNLFGGIGLIGFILLTNTFMFMDAVYLWLGWTQLIMAIVVNLKVGHSWAKVRRAASPSTPSSPS